MESGLTVAQLAQRIGLESSFYGVMINQKSVSEKDPLEDGATVTFYLPMEGG